MLLMQKRKKRAPVYKCFWRCGDPRCPMAMPVQKRVQKQKEGKP